MVSLDTELALDGTHGTKNPLVLVLDQPANLADRADHSRVIFAAKPLAQLWIAGPEPLPANIHRDHSRKAHCAVTPPRLEVGQTNAEVATGNALNVFDASLRVLVGDDGSHRLLGQLEVHREP